MPTEIVVSRFGLLRAMTAELTDVINISRYKKKFFHSNIKLSYDPRKYNVFNINPETLLSNTQNAELKNMHIYFLSSRPSLKNNFTGIFRGYNLILITAEGFSRYSVREDITPTLYKLVNEGWRFKNFYVPIWDVSTIDGEFAILTGLIPKKNIWSLNKIAKSYQPFNLAGLFARAGYKKILAYHNHDYRYYQRNEIYPLLGYSYKALGNGLDITPTWPESDLEMMVKTIPDYINESPFYVYYLTVSGHLEYNFFGNEIALKNKKYVEFLSLSEPAKAYLATQIELDKALEYLLKKLEENNIDEKTVIVLCGDHYPYGLDIEAIEELAGEKVDPHFELYKSSLIIYVKGLTTTNIDKLCSSIDILPTLFNLFGMEFDSRFLIGRDIFSSEPEGIVVFKNRDFITKKMRYIYESNIAIPNGDFKLQEDYISNAVLEVERKFFYSARIIDLDYYRYVFMQKFPELSDIVQ